MINTIFMLLLSSLSIIWTIPLVICSLFWCQLYKINNQQKVILAMKKLPKRSTIMEDDSPRGWIWGWPYIGYVMDSTSSGQYGTSSNIEIYIMTTNKYYNSLTIHNAGDEPDGAPETVEIFDRIGNYFNLRYTKRKLDVKKYSPRKNQQPAIDKIIGHYKTNSSTVAFLHGEPGSGKSMISLLIAKELKGSLCDTFNPTDPGDDIALIYNKVCPTKDSPLVLVFEEVDIMIGNIHYDKMNVSKHNPIQCKNKTEFNRFMDRIDRGIFPNLLLIMTSNKAPEFIDLLDQSYIREGRVNLRIKID